MITLYSIETTSTKLIKTLVSIVKWDGTYEDLRSIVQKYFVKDHKIHPFCIVGTNNEIIYSNKIKRNDCPDDHMFFLFDSNKNLIKSSNRLGLLFQ